MTTCCWDGKTLAADIQSTTGDSIDQAPMQKIFSKLGVYIAILYSGIYLTLPKNRNWISI